ncbi:unnamed protein product [Chrysodeixis includens]|uniref:snRNA-activating protein complex subunit 3 n=1 Tax=Chrysodeixis includens TaxID=689277 RepID=A0A9N8PZI4_CHRIL|nr:unnamed protein product [Chrysodeixis includens]
MSGIPSESIEKCEAENMNTEMKLPATASQEAENMDSNQNQDSVEKIDLTNGAPLEPTERQRAGNDEDYIDSIVPPCVRIRDVTLYTDDVGPQMYNAKGNLVTPPIITNRLPDVFAFLPVFGAPPKKVKLEDFLNQKVREFVGCDMNDEEFTQLENYCSPAHLRSGLDLTMRSNVPMMGVLNMHINTEPENYQKKPLTLFTIKRNRLRNSRDSKGLFSKKLKYRGVRMLPFTQEEDNPLIETEPETTQTTPDADLEPGKDVLYRVRVYRPFAYHKAKDRFTRTRHSVFCYDIMVTGRNTLAQLRDRFVCHNDFDTRTDVSHHPDTLPSQTAKELFPSGFLFINNVFYVDTREKCFDYSEPIRAWAEQRKIGTFPKKDMCSVTLGELVLKLGYPEVYVHQGNCEHVFIFSEVRLLSAADPLRRARYPCSRAIAQNQTTYCTTCAEISAKWVVVGCTRVPFDPSFFCENCFKQYLYKDGKKIGEFQAYTYRGNALNILKPH